MLDRCCPVLMLSALVHPSRRQDIHVCPTHAPPRWHSEETHLTHGG